MKIKNKPDQEIDFLSEPTPLTGVLDEDSDSSIYTAF